MRARPISGLLAALLCALGCASDARRAAVSGTVLVDGKPLERGVINFLPVEGTQGPGAGGAITNGKFALDQQQGPIIGSNRVEIRGFRKTGQTISVMGSPRDEEIQVVPPEFNEKSQEVTTIQPGSNTLNFDIAGVRP
jgi:hypothetical protein